METAIFSTSSKSDLKLLMELAKKLGIKGRKLSKQDIEDFGLAFAIKAGKTGKYVDTESVLKKLKK